MPAPQFQSEESAQQCIEDMLSALAEEESPGFSKYAMGSNLRLIEAKRTTAEDGKTIQSVVKTRLNVDEKMSNQMGNLHGGCVATLVDNLTSMNIFFHTSGVLGEPWSMLGVTQSLQVLYLAGTPVGSTIEVECFSMSVGRSIAVIQADIWLLDENEQRIRKTASGTHTKVDNSVSKL